MRSYPLYPARTTHGLDGVWDFAFLGERTDLDAIVPERIAYADRLTVPGVFDACPAYVGRRGTAAYRTWVAPQAPGGATRLHFGGLGLWARVYVDGVPIGTCDLPYSGWWLDVPPSPAARRELVVVVDNRFDPARMPLFQPWYDFYAYGGIYRPVVWHETPPCHIDRARVVTLDPAAGRIRVDALLRGPVPDRVDLVTRVDSGPELVHSGAPVRDGRVRLELTVPDARAWTPTSPHLHTLAVGLGADRIVERFGLRVVRAEGRRIVLNGEPLLLKGFCRHESHAQFGPALPPAQMVHDLQLLREMGCNFVRGAHYPQDQRFLDLCDELGFLVFEETLGWGYDAAQWRAPAFRDANLRQARAMVHNSFNHPSVILWGFLNEGGSHEPACRPLYEAMAGVLREQDPTRLVTYASNRVFEGAQDRCFDLADVVSLNVYPGWYALDRDTPAPLGEIVPAIRKWLDEVDAAGHAGSPILLSEIGAGAIYGWRDRMRVHWSEEYQEDYLCTVLSEVLSNPRLSGVAIWQFCDGRTFATARALGRPRTFNNKGVVDEYRRPKRAFDAVRALFTQGAPS